MEELRYHGVEAYERVYQKEMFGLSSVFCWYLEIFLREMVLLLFLLVKLFYNLHLQMFLLYNLPST